MNNIYISNGVTAVAREILTLAPVRNNIHVPESRNLYSLHYFHTKSTQEAKLRARSLHEDLTYLLRFIHNCAVFGND